MNVSGIRPSIGFYDSNSIQFRQDIGAMPVDDIELNVSVEDNQQNEQEYAEARKAQTFGAYDYASQYKPGQEYDLKGADSDIKSLDVEKAVSDMQKDSIIHRYQYFVQNKPSQNSESASNKATEDFSL